MTIPNVGPAVDATTIEAAEDHLRGAGMRVSAARRLVLEILFAADQPLSAERIAAGVDGRLPRSDLASVYRNLEALEGVGLVRHFHLGHGPGLYARSSLSRREYLICDACGAHRSVEPARLDEVRDLIRRDFGHEASFTHFPIAGLCPECAASS